MTSKEELPTPTLFIHALHVVNNSSSKAPPLLSSTSELHFRAPPPLLSYKVPLQGATTQGHTTSELQGHTTSELQDHTTSELQHMQYLQLGLPEEEHTPQTQLKTKHGRIITRLLGTVIEYDTLRHSLFKKTLLAQLQRDIQIEKTNLLSRIYFNTHHSLPD